LFRGKGLLELVSAVEVDRRLRMGVGVVLRGTVGRRRLAVAGYRERSLLVFVVVGAWEVDRDLPVVAGYWEEGVLMVAVDCSAVDRRCCRHRRWILFVVWDGCPDAGRDEDTPLFCIDSRAHGHRRR